MKPEWSVEDNLLVPSGGDALATREGPLILPLR